MLKRVLIVLAMLAVAVVSFAKCVERDAGSNEELKKEVMQMSNEREEALAKGDVATLDRIDANDLVYANWRGVKLTKAQHLLDIKSRKLTFQIFDHTDVQVIVHGNTGIVSGLSSTHVDYKGKSPIGARRFVNVFSKENGVWHCVVHFESPVAQ